jgi:hypothetical protein
MKSDIERRQHRCARNAIDQRERVSGLSTIATRKFLVSQQCLSALALISCLVLGTPTAYAETVTVTGANGTVLPPGIGTPGGDAVANAGPGPGPDPTNTANAFGGTGGSFPPNILFPGPGGNGGNATSTATTSIITGPASANSGASGGAGGSGSSGGNGGNAISAAITSTTSGSANANSSASGGDGGSEASFFIGQAGNGGDG